MKFNNQNIPPCCFVWLRFNFELHSLCEMWYPTKHWIHIVKHCKKICSIVGMFILNYKAFESILYKEIWPKNFFLLSYSLWAQNSEMYAIKSLNRHFLGLRFLDRKRLAFRSLVHVLQIWLFFIHRQSPIFFITN